MQEAIKPLLFTMEEVGYNLRCLRNDFEMTLKDLSIFIDIPINSISRYEKGEHEPLLSQVYKFIKCFGITIDDLTSCYYNIEKKVEKGKPVQFFRRDISNNLVFAKDITDAYYLYHDYDNKMVDFLGLQEIRQKYGDEIYEEVKAVLLKHKENK